MEVQMADIATKKAAIIAAIKATECDVADADPSVHEEIASAVLAALMALDVAAGRLSRDD
jgi:hypothetical protein